MPSTTNRSYPYPAGNNAADVVADLEALADAIDTDVQDNLVQKAGDTLTGALIPAAVSGTPVANGLYQENVVKGWVYADSLGGIVSSYTVASRPCTPEEAQAALHELQGVVEGPSEVVLASAEVDNFLFVSVNNSGKAVGSVRLSIRNSTTGALTDPNHTSVLAMGGQ